MKSSGEKQRNNEYLKCGWSFAHFKTSSQPQTEFKYLNVNNNKSSMKSNSILQKQKANTAINKSQRKSIKFSKTDFHSLEAEAKQHRMNEKECKNYTDKSPVLNLKCPECLTSDEKGM